MHLHPEGTTARFFQTHPVAAIDALEALKFAMEYFHNPMHPARLQGLAVIELIEMQHAPRRCPLHTHCMTIGDGGALVECRWVFTEDGDIEGLQVWMDTQDILTALTEAQVIEIEEACHKAAEAAYQESKDDSRIDAYIEQRLAA